MNLALEKFDNAANLFANNQTILDQARLDPDFANQILNAFEDIDDLHAVNENKALSDKQVINENQIEKFNWGKLVDKSEELSCYGAIAANVVGGFLQLMDLPDNLKKKIENTANLVLNASYFPYGLSGMKNGAKKKNFFQTIGFLGEAIIPWFGNLKDIYLMRGLATGTDQIWVATDPSLDHKYPHGKFDTWINSIKEIPKTCIKLIKEMIDNPSSVIPSLKGNDGESKGHLALLSSAGSMAASIGYYLTKNEKLFGPIRDLSAVLFDFELLFRKNVKAIFSGSLFITESILDFTARYLENNNMRLFVNMLSHAAGRIALRLYKLLDPAAEG